MDKERLKNHTLIAEFLGLRSKIMLGRLRYLCSESYWCLPEGIPFHSSWNDLMPVIEKISKLSLPDLDGCSENWEPFPRTFGMVSDDTGNFMFRFNRHKMYEAPVLIDAAYSAVVDFLKGYCQLKGGENG